MNRNSRTATIALLTAALALSPVAGQAAEGDDEWEYRLVPYLWLPTISGDIGYDVPSGSGTGAPTVDVGPADWLDLLNFGVLIGGSAKKGRYSVYSDFVYLSMTSEGDRVASVSDTVTIPGTPFEVPVGASLNADTETDVDGALWSITAGYEVLQDANSQVTLFAGVRYFDAEVATDWNLTAEVRAPGGGIILPAQGSISDSVTLWDGIVGVRGEFGSGKWTVPYYADIGAGDSDLTFNTYIALAREFGWGELLFAYRHLEYDQGDDALIQDFSFSGPAIGARFHF